MRHRLERWLRWCGVGALVLAFALALWEVLRPSVSDGVLMSVRTLDATRADSGAAVAREVMGRLVQEVAREGAASVSPTASNARDGGGWPRLHLTVSTIPSGVVRTVLGDAAAAGVPVGWTDSTALRDVSLEVSAGTTPSAATLITARGATFPTPDTSNSDHTSARTSASTASSPSISDSRSAIVVRDDGGLLDSVGANTSVLALRAAAPRGRLRAEVIRDGHVVAQAVAIAPPKTPMRRVFLYAMPGWESKFTVAALEEAGWNVDGRLRLAPRALTRIGTPGALDTARYAVTVVLDSGVADAAALRRFVAMGGGVVISGDALRDPALGDLRVARVMDVRPPIAGALLTPEPRRGLATWHLSVDSQTTVLEREGSDAVVVVARRGVGRLLASGYRETWRWRMEGSDESADDHRRWWSHLLGTVAFVPGTPDSLRTPARGLPGDAAPFADMVARIGSSAMGEALPSSRSGFQLPLWLLFAIGVVALVTEWALRRTRGSP